MARHSPISDYLADSESSDFDFDYESDSDYITPKMKPSYNHQKSRHVTVRTPSEEDLYQQNKLLNQSRRPSTPYALTRNSSYTDEEPYPQQRKEKQQSRDQPAPVTTTNNPATAPATAAPGVQSYNNPAGSTAALGFNNVYIHGTANPNGFSTGQPFAINPNQPNTPFFHGGNFASQPAPFFIANGPNTTTANMPEQLGGYQNSVPFNPGVMHFQPQTPDTSLGPMHHNYIPRFDGGGVYMVQPGTVCHSAPSLFAPSPLFLSPPINMGLQEVRPLTFAPQTLVLGPQSTIAVCHPFFASASVVTTLGHKGPDGVVAPREIVVRRDSCFAAYLTFSRLPGRCIFETDFSLTSILPRRAPPPSPSLTPTTSFPAPSTRIRLSPTR